MSFCTIHFNILTRIIQQEGTEIGINDLCFIWATGDLAKRKIYPALYNLYRDQKLPKQISVIGLGRREVSHVDFQKNKRINRNVFVIEKKVLQNSKVLDNFRYCPLDVSKPEDYERLLQVVREREEELHIKGNRMFYLSVAPEFLRQSL